MFVLVVFALASAVSGSQADVSNANDISFLQASLEFHQQGNGDTGSETYFRVGGGDCHNHYVVGGMVGIEACAKLCASDTDCEVFSYGASLGCRYSKCGSGDTTRQCLADKQCPNFVTSHGGTMFKLGGYFVAKECTGKAGSTRTNEIGNENDCRAAQEQLGFTYAGTEDWTGGPKGCYVNGASTVTSVSTRFVFFNKAATGTALEGYSMICLNPGPLCNALCCRPADKPNWGCENMNWDGANTEKGCKEEGCVWNGPKVGR
jgi:hypothetical protein